MSNLANADFMSRFPPALQQDEKMIALGRIVAEELRINAQNTEKNLIYANIDSLSEMWLDVLAYDLHVDWYNYDYPVEAKRALIKDSVRVHQKLGTVAAVEMALGGLHPNSKIEEWFDYGGSPYRFRIVLDTTKSKVAADYDEIVKTVDIYKRLSAHLDGLYYQHSSTVIIMAKAEGFVFDAVLTGQIHAGTEPYRSTEGAVAKSCIVADTEATGYRMEATRTGTKPDRSIIFEQESEEIVTDSDTEAYKYLSTMAGKETTGTIPYISTVGGAGNGIVGAVAAVQPYKFESDLTGTLPDRAIQTNGEAGAISQTAEIASYQYEVKRCGASGLSK